MKTKLTEGTAALLALALVMGLAACGDGGRARGQLAFQTAAAYTSEEVPLPVETGTLYGCCAGEGCMYLLAAGEEDAQPSLYRVPLDGGETEKMAEYHLPEHAEIPRTVNLWDPFLGGDGKLWLLEQYTIFYYDLPEDFDEASDSIGRYTSGQDDFCHLRQLDPRTGRELEVVDMGPLLQNLGVTERLTGLTVDGQGLIYVATNRKIRVLDSTGTVLFTLNAAIADGAEGTLALTPDGTAAALVDSSGGSREVRTIDPAAQDWGGVYPVTGSVWGLTGGSGVYQFFFQRNNTLYGRREGEPLDERLLRWEDAGLGTSPNVACFALLDGGRAAALTWTRPEGGSSREFQIRLQLFTPSDQLPSDGKVRLVYGTIGDDGWARTRVNRFNESSDTYYIELRDYAEGMLDSHGNPNYIQIRDAALKRLSAEIIAGRAPDILDDREIPLSALARQGLLADLWPLIEGDPELGRESVMEHVLECAETDGKLYQVFSGFRIDTMTASAEIAGDRTGWTLEEMEAAYGGTIPKICQLASGAINPFLQQLTPDALLRNLLYMDMDRFVDWNAGECSFDTEAFRDILRLCGAQESGGPELISPVLWEGEPAVMEQTIGCMADLTLADAIFGGPDVLMDYEAQMAENGITAYQTKVDGEWTGVTDIWLGEAERIREEGRVLASTEMMADFVSGALAEGGCAAYAGYPAGTGSGSCFRIEDCLSITEACRDREGAWQFVRQLLLPDGNLASRQQGLQTAYDAFPVNRADFEALLEPEWFTDEAGAYLLDRDGNRIEKASGIFVLGDPGILLVFLRTPRQTQLDRFRALYDAIDRVEGTDSGLLDIILEQAQPYFAGDKGLDETAALIQNRASLYVNENR